jgi:hypothetical protein
MARSIASIRLGAILLAIHLVSGQAEAEEAGGALSRGQDLLRSFEFDAAIEQFEAVVADESSSASDRLAALERIGATYFNTDRRDQARAAFARLIDCDPGHALTGRAFPPPVQQFFAEVRGAHQPAAAATVDAAARETSPGSGRVRLRAAAAPGCECAEVAVARVRTAGGAGDYEEVALARDGAEFAADLDAPAPGEELEYVVELRAPSGQVVGRAGSVELPLTYATPAPLEDAPVEPPAEGPARRRWYRSWWFWTIVGVAVAGAGVTTAVVLTRPEDPTGSLGSGRLE